MKTKHRVFSIVALAVLLRLLIAPYTALAAAEKRYVVDNSGVINERELAAPEGRLPRFIDDLALLTPARADELTARLDEISERHQFDVVVAVVPYFDDEPPVTFAYGFGGDLGSAILLFSIDQYRIRSKFRFFANGFGSKAFTPAGQEYLLEQFKSRLDLGRRNYFEAFMAYADDADDFLTKAKTGKPYDTGNIPLGEPVDILSYIAVNSLGPLLVVALIVMEIWKSRSKAVRRGNH